MGVKRVFVYGFFIMPCHSFIADISTFFDEKYSHNITLNNFTVPGAPPPTHMHTQIRTIITHTHTTIKTYSVRLHQGHLGSGQMCPWVSRETKSTLKSPSVKTVCPQGQAH